MSVFTGVILYLLIWWLALFCVLPVGTRPDSQGRLEEGGWRGAPQKHLMGWKLLGTTALAGVIWFVIYLLIESDWLSFRSGILSMPPN
jgi:predicted secreted protein